MSASSETRPELLTPINKAPATGALDVAEKVTKLVFAGVAFLYALGLIVANQYLMSLGISDFSSIKPKHIITGAWVALMFFAASFPVLLPVAMWIRHSELGVSKKRKLWLLFYGIFGGILSSFLTEFLIALTLNVNLADPNFHDQTKTMVIAVSVSILVIGGSWRYCRKSRGRRLYGAAVAIIFIPNVIFGTARDFIQPIYVRVPEALGGAKPSNAELMPNTAGAAFWSQTGAIKSSPLSPSRTPAIKILFQNDTQLVVKVPQASKDGKERIIILDKKLVDGILPIDDK